MIDDPECTEYHADHVEAALWAIRQPAPEAEVEARLWSMWIAPYLGALDQCIMGTRPRGAGDVHVTDDGMLYWLRPLAIALDRGWRMHPGDRAGLAAWSRAIGCTPSDARLRAMQEAVLVVQSQRGRPGPVRIGGHWVTGDDGRKRSDVVPVTLEYRRYLRWFAARCLREARRILRAEAPAPGEALPDNLSDPQPGALYDMVAGEAAAADRAKVAALYDAARDDRDRAMLDSIADGASIAEASRQSGLSVEAGKKRIQRLRARVRSA